MLRSARTGTSGDPAVGVLVLLLRGVFGLGTFVIVAAGVLDAWASGQFLLALVAFVATPITFFVYPWVSGSGLLQLVWVVSMVAFVGGNVVGRGAGRSGGGRTRGPSRER